ncbi:MAG: PQQ-binding-like beta-propeller repeat protein [Pirellulaceae bacterium]|nr:PQQ-binding-like beta-propeller repeat protein [Pirellulaceae bacterium]
MLKRFLSLAAVCCAAQLVHAEDWPQWRGPRGDGVSAEKSVATKWSKTEHIAWRAPLPGQGGATPAAWGDKLFVTSADGDALVLICISATNGKQLWSKQVASGNQDARAGEGNSASPSPATDGKHVWAYFGTGVLACFDIDGNEVWKFDTGERFGKIDIQFGMTSTPVLDGDNLYLQLIHGAMRRDDNTRTGKVIKLDKLTGKTVWEVDRVTNADFECKHSYASPFIYNDGKRKFLVVHGADCTTGHALDDGHELWRFGKLNGPTQHNSKQHDPTFRFVASPLVVPGLIVIPTCKEGPTLAINVNDELKGDVSDNKNVVRWTLANSPDVSIPVAADGLVYHLHKDGKLQCMDLETGKEVYFERTHSVQHRASPIIAGGHVYLCAKDGRCTVVKTGREFSIVASNDLGEPITASPLVAGGVLYLRTYNALYAIK